MSDILLIEDNLPIAKGLKFTLQAEGFQVKLCADKKTALEAVYSAAFDLVLLDVMLPDGSGFDICREIKTHFADMPVIFLTAKDEENDVVQGFDLGADDYVVKPFRSRELLSRIHTVLRRYQKDEKTITVGNVTLDTAATRVLVDGRDAGLSSLEYKLLLLLFRQRGQTVTREQIMGKIWDISGNFVNDNTLTVYIKRLREKLGADLIKTVKGIGYRVDK